MQCKEGDFILVILQNNRHIPVVSFDQQTKPFRLKPFPAYQLEMARKVKN
ncbi:MAG: hypothetical protein ACR2GN_07210 [Bacteroidia bacterium]